MEKSASIAAAENDDQEYAFIFRVLLLICFSQLWHPKLLIQAWKERGNWRKRIWGSRDGLWTQMSVMTIEFLIVICFIFLRIWNGFDSILYLIIRITFRKCDNTIIVLELSFVIFCICKEGTGAFQTTLRAQLCYYMFYTSCYFYYYDEKDDGFYQSCAHWFDMSTLIFHSYHHLIIIIFPNFAHRLFSLSLFVSVVIRFVLPWLCTKWL